MLAIVVIVQLLESMEVVKEQALTLAHGGNPKRNTRVENHTGCMMVDGLLVSQNVGVRKRKGRVLQS